MIVGVKNLGPLEEAQVDLSKQLIVLAGPNGSGKTYLAWTMYGLFRLGFVPIIPADEFLAPCIDKALETSELDPQELIHAYGQAFADHYVQNYMRSAHRVFAVDPASFTQTGLTLRLARFPDAGLVTGWHAVHVVPVSEREEQDIENLLIYWSAGVFKFGFIGRENWGETIESVVPHPRTDVHDDSLARLSLVRLSAASDEARAEIPWERVFAQLMTKLLFQNCVIFPAERIATSIFAKELSLKRFDLVEKMLAADVEVGGDVASVSAMREAAQRYPWPIRDSLRVASDLERLSRARSEFEDLADEMEKEIVGGKVKVGQYGQLAFSPASTPDLQLGIHVTASVVKSLSSLVFYFRHMAEPGDFLIIDEPELNLHPDNQRKVARLLAKAVNRGFKIMISSHSDYLMRELDNLIMLSQPRAAQLRERLGYAEDELLRPEQLGVYLFKDGRATEVEVTDTGFSIETIDQEINRLNEVSQEIYASLFQDDADEP